MPQTFLLGKRSSLERRIGLLLAALVGYATISRAVVQLIQLVWHVPYQLDTLARMGLLALLALSVLPKLLKRFPIVALLPGMFITGLLLLGWLSSPESGDMYPKILIPFLTECAVSYWICSSVHAEEDTVRDLAMVAVLITAGVAIQILVIREALSEGYSQLMGYELLLAVVISLAQVFDFAARHRLLHLANIFVGVVLMLAAGARGPVACAGLFALFLVLVSKHSKILKVTLLVLCTTFAVLYFSGAFEALLEALRNRMLAQEMSVRTLDKLLSGEFFSDNARSVLAVYSWKEIISHPFWGVGPGHDRIMLAPVLGVRTEEAIGCYPHNLVLELLLHYGLLLGGILVIGLLVLFLKGCCLGEDTPLKKMAQIFFGFGVLPLFFSGSYLSSPLFFGWIALSLRAVHVQKHPSLHRNLSRLFTPAT